MILGVLLNKSKMRKMISHNKCWKVAFVGKAFKANVFTVDQGWISESRGRSTLNYRFIILEYNINNIDWCIKV